MRNLTDRLAKLDEAISIYDCMRKTEDAVVIKMIKELFSELIAVNCPYVIYSTDGLSPHKYKGHVLELVSNQNYVSVAYFNTRTGKEHHLKEIKENDNAI